MSEPMSPAPADNTADNTAAQAVVAGAFLTLHYRLSGPSGEVVSTFGGKPSTLSLGAGDLSPALEEKLLGLLEGEEASFELPAGVAFGERNPDMLQWVSAKLLHELGDPQEVYLPGEVVEFPTPDGQGSYAGAVVQVREDGAVRFDFNHPLAGQPVRFDVQIIGVL